MLGYDDTTDSTATMWDNEDTSTVTIYSTGIDNYDYEPVYYDAEWEAVRFGWHNPRKIQIPKKFIQKHINIQIRNSLPYKMRQAENCL